MVRGKSCVVSRVLSLVLRASCFVGVAPVRVVPRRSGYSISVSRRNAFYNYFVFFLTCLCVVVGIYLDKQIKGQKGDHFQTKPGNFMFFVKIFTVSVAYTTGSILGTRRINNMIDNLNYIEKIKLILHYKEHKKDIKMEQIKISTFTIYLLSLSTLMAWTTYLIRADYKDERIRDVMTVLFVTYAVHVVGTSAVEAQVFILIYDVLEILTFMNDELEKTLKEYKDRTKAIYNRFIMYQKIRSIASAYLHVCEAISKQNNTDGHIVLLMCGYYTAVITSTAYYYAVMYTSVSGEGIFMKSSYCALHTFKILLFIETCHRINREVTKLGYLSSKLMYKTTNIGMSVPIEVDVLYKQTLLHDARYSPLGIFTMQRSLITTILSVVITYLVIIMQWK